MGSHPQVLTLATFLCLSQAWTWLSNVMYHGFFVFNDLGQEDIIVHFVDTDRIVDHHYLFFI